jgi:hypothetical protein
MPSLGDNGKGKAKKVIADVAAGAIVVSTALIHGEAVVTGKESPSAETTMAALSVAGAIKIKGNMDSTET